MYPYVLERQKWEDEMSKEVVTSLDNKVRPRARAVTRKTPKHENRRSH